MKLIAYLALLGVSSAVKIVQDSISVAQARENMELKVQGLDDDSLQKLVDDAVKNAKLGDTKFGASALVTAAELKAVEKALAERIYNRIIDTGYYRPALGSLYYRPGYWHPTYDFLPWDLESAISRVLGFHDYIGRYELENHVISHVTDPAVVEILGVMYDVMQKKGSQAEAAANNKANQSPAVKQAPAPAAKSLAQNNNQEMAFQQYKKQALNQGISEEAMNRMVDQAVLNAKANKISADPDALQKDAQMRAVEEILADQIANRIISEGYWRPGWRSPYYRPYYPVYRTYLYPSPALSYELNRLLSYHDYLDRYETVNRILSHTLNPQLEEILKAVYDVVYGAPAAGGASNSTANATAPAAKTLLQMEGVPVFVNPTLIQNTLADADLQQRDSIIDGINGSDFVQLDNPVENPPFNNWSVNQPSPPHRRGMKGKEDLGLRDITIDGINGYAFAQTNQDMSNPVENPPFNNWSVNQPSPPHAHGMKGNEDLGLDLIVRGHHIKALSQLSNPVENPPFNNWSVNQPSPPHAHGMKGNEDLGLDLIVRGHHIKALAQTTNPVENPPFNNWSIHQPSRPHDSGMKGTEDLGMDMIVNGHAVHVAQGEGDDDSLGMTMTINGQKITVAQGDIDDGSRSEQKMVVSQLEAPAPTPAKGLTGNEDLGMNMRVSGDNVHVGQLF